MLVPAIPIMTRSARLSPLPCKRASKSRILYTRGRCRFSTRCDEARRSSSQDAKQVQACCGACAVEPAEWRHHCGHHAGWCAAEQRKTDIWLVGQIWRTLMPALLVINECRPNLGRDHDLGIPRYPAGNATAVRAGSQHRRGGAAPLRQVARRPQGHRRARHQRPHRRGVRVDREATLRRRPASSPTRSTASCRSSPASAARASTRPSSTRRWRARPAPARCL